MTLVPWVAAFGLAGQLAGRLPARALARAPVAGCLLLTAAYAGVAIALVTTSTEHRSLGLLIGLLTAGGLGLGINFSALIAHLTNAVPDEYAPDISGVSTTTLQIGGAIGVAAFGTLYRALSDAGAASASHAFGLTCLALGAAALVATGAGVPSHRTGTGLMSGGCVLSEPQDTGRTVTR